MNAGLNIMGTCEDGPGCSKSTLLAHAPFGITRTVLFGSAVVDVTTTLKSSSKRISSGETPEF